MRRFLCFLAVLVLVLSVYQLSLAEEAAYVEEVVSIDNNGRIVPATVCLPEGEAPFPLVVIHHGFGGNREENGGLAGIARALTHYGIASIRIDFPGCGESDEPFTENYLSNMISDSNASLRYALDNYPINEKELGILGYGMGGRVALIITSGEGNPYSAMALLAPSCREGSEALTAIMGREAFETLRKEANAENDSVEYTTVGGQNQTMSRIWFDELLASNPVKNITFKGPSLVIYSMKDTVVTPEEALSAAHALSAAGSAVAEVEVEEADHGYGFYSDQPKVTTSVNNSISGFFAGALQ